MVLPLNPDLLPGTHQPSVQNTTAGLDILHSPKPESMRSDNMIIITRNTSVNGGQMSCLFSSPFPSFSPPPMCILSPHPNAAPVP